MTPERRAELRALLAAMGAGEWRAVPWHVAEGPPHVGHADGWLVACELPGDDYANLIAAARNDLPALLDAFDAAEARLDASEARERRLREALEVIRDSRFCNYENSGAGSYGIGVTDGHRFCANIARAALSEVAPDA